VSRSITNIRFSDIRLFNKNYNTRPGEPTRLACTLLKSGRIVDGIVRNYRFGSVADGALVPLRSRDFETNRSVTTYFLQLV